jgi:hypothetical protein
MRLKTLGAVLVALLALGAVVAAGASAHAWELREPLTKAEAMASTGTLQIEVPKEHQKFTCQIREEGTVGPGAAGTITALTNTASAKEFECEHNDGLECTGAHLKVEVKHLPWDTELATIGGALRDEIKSGGSGTPEVKMSCGGSENWWTECYFATSVGITNHAEDVEGTYDEKSDPLENTCGGFGFNQPLYYIGYEKIHLAEHPEERLKAV